MSTRTRALLRTSALLRPRALLPRERRLYNPPGRTALRFRIGTYESFYRRMLAHLRTQPVPGLEQGTVSLERPLAELGLHGSGWIQGLLDAWAAVGDVLTFYQERIANEGYLGTATQQDSIGYLVSAIDYQAQPGVAAEADLAFLVAGGGNLPSHVTVPAGLSVRTLPAADGTTQVFETMSAFGARAAWSALQPVSRSLGLPQVIGPDTTTLTLAGTATGLKPGSGLLLVAPDLYFRTISTVTVQAAGTTQISWQPALGGSGTYAGPQALTFGQQAQLFGYNAPDWSTLPLAVKQRYGTRRGGAAQSLDAGRSWTALDDGLPTAEVTALVYSASGTALAGTSVGLYVGTADGTWIPVGAPLGKTEVPALAVAPDGHLYAGAGSTVYRSTDDGATWEPVAGTAAPPQPRPPSRADLRPGKGLLTRLKGDLAPASKSYFMPRLPAVTVRGLAVATGTEGTWVFAGTDQGIFRSADPSSGWEAANEGLPGVTQPLGLTSLPVRALAAGWEPGQVFAATDRGVFASTDYGRRWRAASDGLPRGRKGVGPTTSLAVLDDARQGQRSLFAATGAGVFRSGDGGESWQEASAGLPRARRGTRTGPAAVSLVASATDTRTLASTVFAVTARGLYLSADLGASWQRATAGPAAWGDLPVTALAAAGSQVLLACPFRGFLEDQWPGFAITDGQIDLSTVVAGVLPGSWVILKQSQPQPPPLPPLPPKVGIYQAEDVLTVVRTGYTLTGKVTRIEVADDGQLGSFDLRQTDVLVVSRELPVWQLPLVEPCRGRQITVVLPHGEEPPLPGSRLAIRGKPARASLAGGPARPLLSADGAHLALVPPGEPFRLLSAPRSLSGNGMRCHIQSPTAGTGYLDVPAPDLAFHPAAPGDEEVTQLTDAVGAQALPESAGGVTTAVLQLAHELESWLSPADTRLSANLTRATQGQSVTGEVLGNGDATRAFQRFKLVRKPLTFVYSQDGVPTSTLRVLVDGVPWKEVPTLAEEGPQSQSYMVRLDFKGQATVFFGDGIHGARLPSGQENVKANYRYGLWPAPLAGNSLTLLQQRPLGVQGVTNPAQVSGGAAAEPAGDARQRAPLTLRTLDRVVSLADYGDYARTYPGIAKATARAIWNGRSLLVALTVAGPEGQDVSGATLTPLCAAIAHLGGAGQPVAALSYQALRWELDASLVPAPGQDARGLVTAAEASLATAFSFDSRRFAEGLAASQVIAVLQAVPGVLAVQLAAFYVSGESPGLASHLDALPARWDARSRQVLPAQLLLLASQGVRLTVEGPS